MGAPAGAQPGNGNPPANSNAGGNGNAPANSNAGGNGNAPANSNAGGNGNAAPGGSGGSTSGGGNAPPGNNGTIKVDEFTMDPGNDNDTHLPCGGFSVSFFGYDGGSTAHTGVIYVTPWAPTSGGTKGTFGPFTVTPAGWTRTSGNQFDTNYQISWTQLAPLFTGVTPTAQGYHVRIEVEVTGSQGADDKFKMAWLTPCAPTPPTPGGPGPVGGTPPPTPLTPPPTPPAPPTSPSTAGLQATNVLPTTLTTSNLPLGRALPSTAGLSGATTSPGHARLVGALAFTGLVLLPILGGGLLLSGLGTLLVRWSRRHHRVV